MLEVAYARNSPVSSTAGDPELTDLNWTTHLDNLVSSLQIHHTYWWHCISQSRCHLHIILIITYRLQQNLDIFNTVGNNTINTV